MNNGILDDETMNDILHTKYYNEDSKQITKQLINNKVPLDKHNNFMNETDRTIVALLWHENIIDMLNKSTSAKSIPIYLLDSLSSSSILIIPNFFRDSFLNL